MSRLLGVPIVTGQPVLQVAIGYSAPYAGGPAGLGPPMTLGHYDWPSNLWLDNATNAEINLALARFNTNDIFPPDLIINMAVTQAGKTFGYAFHVPAAENVAGGLDIRVTTNPSRWVQSSDFTNLVAQVQAAIVADSANVQVAVNRVNAALVLLATPAPAPTSYTNIQSGTRAVRRAYTPTVLTEYRETDTCNALTFYPGVGWRNPFGGDPDAAPPPVDTGVY